MSFKGFALVVILVAGFSQWDVTSSAQSTSRQNSYFIQGAVNRPGVYQIESSPSILKLITLAGGLSDNHGRKAYIIRRLTPQTDATESEIPVGAEYSLISLDISGLLKSEFTENALLTGGDIVNIPPGDVFFITGNANRMTVFPLIEGMRLSQAISLTNDDKSGALIQEVVILRHNHATGKREEIKVNLGELTSGNAIDIVIEANDVIVLPNSRSGITPKLLDAPPKRVLVPCRSGRPCIARLGSNDESASD